MPAPPSRPRLLVAAAIAAVSFGLGVVATRWWGASDAPTTAPPGSSPTTPADAGAPGPQLFIDASGIVLLPDASLHLDLGRFDSGRGGDTGR